MKILSLCDYSGAWSEPYRKAGYEVVQVDLQHGGDVRLFEHPGTVRGVLAAPPCTALAVSGARWWAGKGEGALLEALAIADACVRIAAVTRAAWWALENPSGRLSRYYGPPTYSFDPCDYGDPYTKRTHLWGRFNPPTALLVGEDRSVEPEGPNPIHYASPGPERANFRSKTPEGFARAFFQANP